MAKTKKNITTPAFAKAGIITGFAIAISACGGGATLFDEPGTAPQVAPVAIAVESEAPVVRDDTPAVIEIESDSITLPPMVSSASAESFLQDVVARNGSFRLMSMGDSITQGVRGAASYRLELKNLLSDEGCPAILVGSQSTASPDVGFYGAHEGYSGHSTTDFLEGRGQNEGAAVNVGYHKPDIVLLHIGSVDIWRDFDVAGTLARIDQLVALIQSTRPGTFVLLANLIPWVDTSSGADKPVSVAELGNQIEAYIEQSGNPLLQLVDVRSGFSVDMLQSDLIHPNESGDAHIADAFFDHLDSDMYCGS